MGSARGLGAPNFRCPEGVGPFISRQQTSGRGLNLNEKIGFKRAAVAVARKPAVIMHTILKIGEFFEKTVGAVA